MFGLGAGEMLIILAFALIFIGPKKLPELARNLGKGLREFQNAKDEFMQHVESEKSEINHTLSEAESESEDSADSEDHDPALTGVEEPVESPTAKGSETSEKISEEEVVAEAKAMEEALKKADDPSTPSS